MGETYAWKYVWLLVIYISNHIVGFVGWLGPRIHNKIVDFFEIHGWDSSTGASAARGANFAPKPPVVPVAPAACAGLVKCEGESWVIHETRVIFWESDLMVVLHVCLQQDDE